MHSDHASFQRDEHGCNSQSEKGDAKIRRRYDFITRISLDAPTCKINILSYRIPPPPPILKMSSRAEDLSAKYEPRPDPQALTSNPDASKNASTGVDYEPHPAQSVKIPPERERIIKSITALYSGSASEADMQVYAPEAIYDDPWSYCDTRYKIAGQWYGTCAVSPFQCLGEICGPG